MKRFDSLARRAATAALAVVTAAGMVPTAAFAQAGAAAGAGEVAAAEAISGLAATGDIASGTSGTCTWVIDSEGALTVSPTEGDSGELGTWVDYHGVPWYSYRAQITSARFVGDVKAQTCYEMFYGCSSLASVDLSGLDTSSVTNMRYMFYGCTSLASLDLSALDTSSVAGMGCMFDGCTSLDASTRAALMRGLLSANGGKCNDWCEGLFDGCPDESIVFSELGLDTSSVTDMGYMFSGCTSLKSIDLSGLDTSSVISMGYMFYNCPSLTSVDLTGLDVSNVEEMSYMFWSCPSLESVDLSGLAASSMMRMGHMFWGCTSLTSVDLSGLDTSSVTDMDSMFRSCSSLTSLDLSGLDTSSVTGMSGMFEFCSSLTSLDLSGLDTSSLTTVSGMICGCSSLTTLNLSGLNTSQVKGMAKGGMLQWSTMLKSITLTGGTDLTGSGVNGPMLVDTAWRGSDGSTYSSTSEMLAANAAREGGEVTYSTTAHDGWGGSGTCEWRIEDGVLTVRPIDGASGTLGTWSYYEHQPWYNLASTIDSVAIAPGVSAKYCYSLFYNCSNVKSIDLTNLDTSDAVSTSSMFCGCSSLEELNLSGLDTSSVTSMGFMFSGCSSLTSLDLSGLDTSSATDMSSMFSGCTSLASLDLSGLDTSSVTSMGYMFSGCTSLGTIEVGGGWSTAAVTYSTDMFSGCSSLVGGEGTAYDSSHTDATYARVDFGPDSDAPGYLTGVALSASCAPADKGEKATVTTELAGADSATYRFYYSADGGATWKQAARNATGTVQVTATPTNAARQWKVVATTADGRTAEASFAVAINDPAVETSTVPAAKYNAKATVNVSVSHFGTYCPAKYKYYYSADGGATWKQVAYHNRQYTDTDSLQVTANGTNAKRLWKVIVTFKDGRTAEAPFTVSYGA